MVQLKRETLKEGICFNSISDQRFKTNRISLHFITPLKQQTASLNALIPAVLRKGTASHPDFTEFNRYLNELYGAFVDYQVQKIGDWQLIGIYILGIDDSFTFENEKLTETLTKVLIDMAFDPVMKDGIFPEKEVELEKTVLIDSIQAEINDKRTYALNASTRLMCPNEPYGLSKLGTVEQAKAITAQALTEAYWDLVRSSRIEILFTGPGDYAAAKEIIKEKLDCIPRDFQSLPQIRPHLAVEEILEKTEKMDVNQSKMVLGFSTGVTADSQYIPALRLMTAVFGGTPVSKLFMNVREKLSLCYYCVSRMDRMKGIIKVDCGVEKDNIQKAKEEILRQLDEIKKGNITQEEIQNAVMSLKNSYQTIYDSSGAISEFYLAQIAASSSASPEEEADKVLHVTKQQIVEAANLLHLELFYVLTGKDSEEGGEK